MLNKSQDALARVTSGLTSSCSSLSLLQWVSRFSFPLSLPKHALVPWGSEHSEPGLARRRRASRAWGGLRPPRSAWSRQLHNLPGSGPSPFGCAWREQDDIQVFTSLGPPRISPGSVRMGRIQGVPGTPRRRLISVINKFTGACGMDGQPDRARTCRLQSCLGRGCNAMLRGSFEADRLLNGKTTYQSDSSAANGQDRNQPGISRQSD